MQAYVTQLKSANDDIVLPLPAFPTVVTLQSSLHDLWSDGRVLGIDSDVSVSISSFKFNFITLEDCEPITVIGVGGKQVQITKKGLRALTTKALDGRNIVIVESCYYDADAGTNIASAHLLSRLGFSLCMGHATRAGLVSTSNS